MKEGEGSRAAVTWIRRTRCHVSQGLGKGAIITLRVNELLTRFERYTRDLHKTKPRYPNRNRSSHNRTRSLLLLPYNLR